MKLVNDLKFSLVKLMFYWTKLRARLAVFSRWLVIAGLGLIAYGIVYCWKGLPYPVGTLMAYSGYGTLALGFGLSLRRPHTMAMVWLATISYAISLVLIVVTQPGSIFSLALLPLIGVLAGAIKLRMARAMEKIKPRNPRRPSAR
jgi:hypothetical protein